MILWELERLHGQVKPPEQIIQIVVGTQTMIDLMNELHTGCQVQSYRKIPVSVCKCKQAIHYHTITINSKTFK